MGGLTRRGFVAVAAAGPGLTYPDHPSESAVQQPIAAGKRPAVREALPFAEPLTFVRQDATLAVQPFALDEVTLLDGPCRAAWEANRSYLLRLGVDRMVHNFRRNAGLGSGAVPLGGWEEPTSEVRGHFSGHYLSACALSGDRELRARGEEMVAELARCQAKLAAGGYLSAFPVEFFERLDRGASVWAPFYTLHKIMAGLFEMYAQAGNRQALQVAVRMAEWVDGWTAARTEAHRQQILKGEFGGMAEVLYNIAAATGEPRWAQTADRFQKKAFLTPLAQNRDELRHLHANTHIPQVIGAARRWELSGDPRFRDAARFFWHTVAASRSYVTGGTGNREFWLTDPGQLAAEWRATPRHQECCCAYNLMKLARRLYTWDGDPRYFDFYERLLFNHRLGTIQPDTGHSLYFLSLAPGAWKSPCSENDSFWCCAGSALEEFAKLQESIYFQDADGVRVNLFIASELDARERGVRLRQETRFPDEQGTTLTIAVSPDAPWTLRLRIPGWTDSAAVRINGRALEAAPGPGSYLAIRRIWRAGDRVELSLPMRLTVEEMPGDAALRAFLYGPLVLAADFGSDGLAAMLARHQKSPDPEKLPTRVPALRRQGRRLEEWIQPVGSEPLALRVDGPNPPVTLRPLYRLWGRYNIYWNVS